MVYCRRLDTTLIDNNQTKHAKGVMESCPLILNETLTSVGASSTGYSRSNFSKQSTFSPDGTMVLSVCEGQKVYLNKLNMAMLGGHKYYMDKDLEVCENGDLFELDREVDVGESIYDAKWYPQMNAQDEGSCCFATTARDHPISLWDGESGRLRATYIGVNHLDELEAAVSLCFNLAGDKLYSGADRMIRYFDVSRPGKHSTALPTCRSRKALGGQKGIISCLAFNPDRSGAFAAGSYARSIGVYVENARNECVFQIDDMAFGVSHLRWSPCGTYLWAGGRHSDVLQCWDVRNTGSCVGQVQRALQSNQKMSFDLDPWGAVLATGSQDGELLLYSTQTFELLQRVENAGPGCVNSVMFHPYAALLLAGCGERTFNVAGGTDSDSDCESDCDDALQDVATVVADVDDATTCISTSGTDVMITAPMAGTESTEVQLSTSGNNDTQAITNHSSDVKRKKRAAQQPPSPPIHNSSITLWAMSKHTMYMPDAVVVETEMVDVECTTTEVETIVAVTATDAL